MNFNEKKEVYFPKLDMLLPIVERVHGASHEEIYEVSNLYKDIRGKLNLDIEDLDNEFDSLKKLTNNYEIPENVCETYEGIYKMLEDLNKSYDNE